MSMAGPFLGRLAPLETFPSLVRKRDLPVIAWNFRVNFPRLSYFSALRINLAPPPSPYLFSLTLRLGLRDLPLDERPANWG